MWGNKRGWIDIVLSLFVCCEAALQPVSIQLQSVESRAVLAVIWQLHQDRGRQPSQMMRAVSAPCRHVSTAVWESLHSTKADQRTPASWRRSSLQALQHKEEQRKETLVMNECQRKHRWTNPALRGLWVTTTVNTLSYTSDWKQEDNLFK